MTRDLAAALRQSGLVGKDESLALTPLSGGVSSDIYLARTPTAEIVVKAALAQLRVRDAWNADVSRNDVEWAWFQYAARVEPAAVPRILWAESGAGWFALEYFGAGFRTWKQCLLAGQREPTDARRAGEIIGHLHRASWGDPDARARFATRANFHALRIEPYLLTTAQRVPAAAAVLRAEARRLAEVELALVHGDYSPKNLLVSNQRMVVLDAEVAWYGDPAFDAAFLLTHLHLKALLHPSSPEPSRTLITAFWSAYRAALGGIYPEVEARTVRLLLCLLLARVHGKSPVEYLSDRARDWTTACVLSWLPRNPTDLAVVTAAWFQTFPRQ